MLGEVGSNRRPWRNCCVTCAARRSIVLLVSGADRDPVLRTSDVAVPAAAAAGQCPSRTLLAPSPTPLPLLGSHANRQIGQFREELAKVKIRISAHVRQLYKVILSLANLGSHFYARSTHALLPSCIKIIYANLHLVKTA